MRLLGMPEEGARLLMGLAGRKGKQPHRWLLLLHISRSFSLALPRSSSPLMLLLPSSFSPPLPRAFHPPALPARVTFRQAKTSQATIYYHHKRCKFSISLDPPSHSLSLHPASTYIYGLFNMKANDYLANGIFESHAFNPLVYLVHFLPRTTFVFARSFHRARY